VIVIGAFTIEHANLSGWQDLITLYGKFQAILSAFGSYFLISFGVLIVFSFFDFNKLSPHYFYRDRLSDTFLRTFYLNEKKEYVLARDDVDMPLRHLHSCNGSNSYGPYLLINTTLNLTSAGDLGGFNRKSSIFVFSRNFIGSERTDYVKTTAYSDNETRLGRAMTISGAAVTSVMGGISSMAASFACTIFGVRLGYWVQNPRHLAEKGHINIRFWLPLLIRELFCRTHDSGRMVYLSDGGHSGDNLGIISLFQRKAKLIIVSDAECDMDLFFNSFNSSLRQAYVDHGIKVDISIDGFKMNDEGFSNAYHAVGRVLYPDRPWQKSWIILIKNTMKGNEIPPILNYKKKAPEFPHETTGDQFFTEEQFENYKALNRMKAADIFSNISQFIDYCEKDAKGRYNKSDPWSLIENICITLDTNTKKDEEKEHCWDDILRAMYSAEQGGFSSWTAFNEMVKRYVRIKDADLDAANEPMVRDLDEINEWLDNHKKDICDAAKLGPVPRSMKEFRLK
jgi:hypothetical protein